MDFSVYTNADKLQEVELNLKSIHPSLHIIGIMSYKREATSVDVMVKVGGNRDIIDKLVANGWIKTRGCRGNGYRLIVLQKDM